MHCNFSRHKQVSYWTLSKPARFGIWLLATKNCNRKLHLQTECASSVWFELLKLQQNMFNKMWLKQYDISYVMNMAHEEQQQSQKKVICMSNLSQLSIVFLSGPRLALQPYFGKSNEHMLTNTRVFYHYPQVHVFLFQHRWKFLIAFGTFSQNSLSI